MFEAINEIKSVIGENQTYSLLSSIVGATINGETDTDTAIDAFSSQLSIEPEKGKVIAGEIMADLANALINGTASKFNLNPTELMGFVSSCSPRVQSMLMLRILHGEPSVFHELASRQRFNNKM